MLGYTTTTGCRMDYLLRELDDPAAAARELNDALTEQD